MSTLVGTQIEIINLLNNEGKITEKSVNKSGVLVEGRRRPSQVVLISEFKRSHLKKVEEVVTRKLILRAKVPSRD